MTIATEHTLFVPIGLPEGLPIRSGIPDDQRTRTVSHLHAHDCLTLGLCQVGSAVVGIGTGIHQVHAGDLVVFAPLVFHQVWREGLGARWTWLYLDPLRLLADRLGACEILASIDADGVIHPTADPVLATLVSELADEVAGGRTERSEAIRALVTTIMIRLRRLVPPDATEPAAPALSAMRRIAPALELMAEHYAEDRRIEAWSEACAMSPTHFRRCFQACLGSSPYAYLLRLRVNMAARFLRSGEHRIIDIAYRVGFTTLTSFNRAFRQIMGTTPRAWRSQR